MCALHAIVFTLHIRSSLSTSEVSARLQGQHRARRVSRRPQKALRRRRLQSAEAEKTEAECGQRSPECCTRLVAHESARSTRCETVGRRGSGEESGGEEGGIGSDQLALATLERLNAHARRIATSVLDQYGAGNDLQSDIKAFSYDISILMISTEIFSTAVVCSLL